MDYVEIDQARELGGIRLVLTAGVPGPWGESAKYVLGVKNIAYTPVRQVPVSSDDALRAWTAQTSAPVVIDGAKRPLSSWVEILYFAERHTPEPALIPRDSEERMRMFGLAHEVCGDLGFGWQRRLGMVEVGLAAGSDAGGVMTHIGSKYDFREATAQLHAARTAEILETLSGQLLAQRARGSRWFVGDQLSAVDLYWAAFSQMLDPLPHEQNPMPEMLRLGYALHDTEVRKSADPILLEHRDYVFENVVGLPLDY